MFSINQRLGGWGKADLNSAEQTGYSSNRSTIEVVEGIFSDS